MIAECRCKMGCLDRSPRSLILSDWNQNLIFTAHVLGSCDDIKSSVFGRFSRRIKKKNKKNMHQQTTKWALEMLLSMTAFCGAKVLWAADMLQTPLSG